MQHARFSMSQDCGSNFCFLQKINIDCLYDIFLFKLFLGVKYVELDILGHAYFLPFSSLLLTLPCLFVLLFWAHFNKLEFRILS